MQQSTLPKFFELFPPAKAWYKKGDNEIQIPNGGTIYVRSTEDPDRLEGMTIGWAWADEIGQMKRQAWINIQGRLSIHQGKLMGTTTPYNLGWLYKDVYRRFKSGEIEDSYVHEWTSVDNPYFPKEEYERARREMDPRDFARRYEGRFEKIEGLVYQDFDIDTHVVEDIPPQFQSGSPMIASTVGLVDFGYNNPTAILIANITRDGDWYIVDEYYKTEKTTPELIEICKQMETDYKIRMWYADPAEPDRIEEMRKAGMYMRPVNKSVNDGINTLRQLIREKRIKIVGSKCPNLVEEFSLYQYAQPTGDGNEEEKPVKANDHALDALRYGVHSYKPSLWLDLKQKSRIEARRANKKYQFK